MWRNEKRLKQFLASGSGIQEQISTSGIVKRLASKLCPGYGVPAVGESGVAISAGVGSLDDALPATACVKDGLGSLADATGRGFESLSGCMEGGFRVSSVELPETAAIRGLALPGERHVRVRQETMAMDTACRSFTIKIRDAEVFEFEHPQSHPPQVRNGSGFLIKNPSVYQQTSKMCELPLARASVPVEGLQDSERSGFLQEAEALKGIPQDRAQLLAVFRRVPIEMISRLRFLEEKKAIVYTVTRELKRTRTRVHDMGAIRDGVSGEIHLVPHRARYRFASLD